MAPNRCAFNLELSEDENNYEELTNCSWLWKSRTICTIQDVSYVILQGVYFLKMCYSKPVCLLCIYVLFCISRDGWCCWCRLCKYVTWSAGCLWGGLSSKGRTVDSQPGARVDGYSHHEQKKRDLKVSKQVERLFKGNWMKQKGGKRWVDKREMLLYIFAYVHSVIHTLSANSSALC
jgi:hypothetical protein